MDMRRVLAVGVIVIWSSFAAWSQSTTHEKVSPTTQQHAGNKPSGSISGRVFLITEAGDLKPARLANVYLMSGTPDKKDESAVAVFLDKKIEEMKSGSATSGSEESQCLKELLITTDSVQAAAKWAEKTRQYLQFVGTQADEDGAFQISGIVLNSSTGQSLRTLNPETKLDGLVWNYTIVVRGRAGANEAYWEADVMFLEVNGKISWRVDTGELQTGRDASIKFVSPEKSCFVLSH
jgi:hypothetical protein